MFIDVAAGQTARLVIGGTGRTVIGKITTHDTIADKVDLSCSQNWLTRKQPAVKPPTRLDVEAKQKWQETWNHSAEGKTYRRAHRSYGVKLEPDDRESTT